MPFATCYAFRLARIFKYACAKPINHAAPEMTPPFFYFFIFLGFHSLIGKLFLGIHENQMIISFFFSLFLRGNDKEPTVCFQLQNRLCELNHTANDGNSRKQKEVENGTLCVDWWQLPILTSDNTHPICFISFSQQQSILTLLLGATCSNFSPTTNRHSTLFFNFLQLSPTYVSLLFVYQS